ncbi:MAG: hypothetical protein U0228_33200 [Myxococcaceae bacterium]
MLTLTLLTLLSRAPSLASPGWTGADLDPKRVTFLADHLAAQLTAQGLQVITASEIKQALALDRQRQLLGCDTGSCIAEISGALGVDGLITGTVARVGKRLAVSLRIISTGNKTLALADLQADSESELVDLLTREAPRLADDVKVALFGRPSPLASLKKAWWVPVLLGGVAAAVGTTFASLGWARYGALQAHDTATVGADPIGYAATGKTFQTVGLVTATAGLGLALTGVLLLALGPNESAVTASVGPTGASVSIRF